MAKTIDLRRPYKVEVQASTAVDRLIKVTESLANGSTTSEVVSVSIAFDGANGTLDGVIVPNRYVATFSPSLENDTVGSIPYTVPTTKGLRVLLSYIYKIFTPLVYSPSLWLDATDVTTITKDGSDFVSQWDDKSGNANHAIQATGANQPLYSSNGYITFDGINDSMINSSKTADNSYELFVVAKNLNGGSQNNFFQNSGSGSEGNGFLWLVSEAIFIGAKAGGWGEYSAPYTSDSVHLMNYTGDNRDFSVYINNALLFSDTFGTDVLETIDGYRLGYVPSAYGNVQINEVVMFPRQLAAAERENVYNYLSNKHIF